MAQYVVCGPVCTHIVFTYGTCSPQILPPASPINEGNVSMLTFPPPVDMVVVAYWKERSAGMQWLNARGMTALSHGCPFTKDACRRVLCGVHRPCSVWVCDGCVQSHVYFWERHKDYDAGSIDNRYFFQDTRLRACDGKNVYSTKKKVTPF